MVERVPRLRCDRLSLECDVRKALFLEALRAGLRIVEACEVAGWASRGCYTSARARDRWFAALADEAKFVGWGVRFEEWDRVSRLDAWPEVRRASVRGRS